MKGNVKLKRWNTRINRGIVLGIVLLTVLVAFIVIDTAKFNVEKKEIRENIIASITDIAELNKLMEHEQTGKSISLADQAEITEGLKGIFEKYYADPSIAKKITVYDGYDTEETKAELMEWFRRTASMDVHEVRIFDDSEEFQMRFERQGYHFAFVQFNDLYIEIDLLTAVQSPEPFLGAGPSYLIDTKLPEDDIHSALYASNRTLKFFLSGSVYLTDVDGEWKILMSDYYTKAKIEVR